jgi:hypothetical protein
MALYDSRQLSQLFGFDLKKAGVIPVQVKIRNTGNSDITVRSGSTMTDEHGQTWEVLPSSAVFQRIDDYTSGSLSMEEGAKRTLMWGLAGAVVGAAVGVAGGTDVGTAVGKGAAVGAGAGAASAMVGLGKKDTSEDVERDFSERSLESRIIEPGQEVTGYLYFPSESALPKNLRLNLSQGGYRQALDLAL